MSLSIEFKLALFFVESLEINILFEHENFFCISSYIFSIPSPGKITEPSESQLLQ